MPIEANVPSYRAGPAPAPGFAATPLVGESRGRVAYLAPGKSAQCLAVVPHPVAPFAMGCAARQCWSLAGCLGRTTDNFVHLTDETHRLFDGLPVSLMDGDGSEIARGNFVLVAPADPAGSTSLSVEFTSGGVAFMLGIPDEALPSLARTWTGDHFVLDRPAGEWAWLRLPVDN